MNPMPNNTIFISAVLLIDDIFCIVKSNCCSQFSDQYHEGYFGHKKDFQIIYGAKAKIENVIYFILSILVLFM